MKLAHHNLVAWQRADDLFIEVHQLTLQQFPAYERYELGSQLRRAAYSVPANLVEGIAREHRRDQIRFFNIASSSLSELGYGLHACRRLGYIDEATYADLEQKVRSRRGPAARIDQEGEDPDRSEAGHERPACRCRLVRSGTLNLPRRRSRRGPYRERSERPTGERSEPALPHERSECGLPRGAKSGAAYRASEASRPTARAKQARPTARSEAGAA